MAGRAPAGSNRPRRRGQRFDFAAVAARTGTTLDSSQRFPRKRQKTYGDRRDRSRSLAGIRLCRHQSRFGRMCRGGQIDFNGGTIETFAPNRIASLCK